MALYYILRTIYYTALAIVHYYIVVEVKLALVYLAEVLVVLVVVLVMQ